MASLLAKFRIDYSDLEIVPDITSKPTEATQQLFESLIADFRKPENGNFSRSALHTEVLNRANLLQKSLPNRNY